MFGNYRDLEFKRRDIFSNLATISRLASNGIVVREYIRCSCDGELKMDQALYNLRVLKVLYREEIAAYAKRLGPRLPSASQTIAFKEAA